jgi:hypothetical protein
VSIDTTYVLLGLACLFLVARSVFSYFGLFRGYLRQRRGESVRGEAHVAGRATVDTQGNIVLKPDPVTLTLSVPGLSTELLLELLDAPPVSLGRLASAAFPMFATLALMGAALWVILTRSYDYTAVTAAELALAWLVGFWTPHGWSRHSAG